MKIIETIVNAREVGTFEGGYDSDDEPETLLNRRIKVRKGRATELTIQLLATTAIYSGCLNRLC